MEYLINPKPINEASNVDGVWYQDYEGNDPSTGKTVIKKMKYDGSQWVPAETGKIDLTKKLGNSAGAISLKKSTITLDKALINLSKSSGINLQGHRAKVAVDLDYSGSMRSLYRNGNVQKAINRLLPLALRFDDNGELDVWLFETGFRRMESMGIDNFESYVDEEIMSKNLHFGGTNYAPVLQDNKKFYCNGDKRGLSALINKHKDNTPAFVIFITDGDNFDKRDTNNIITELAKENVFIQFVGIGNDDFSYLKRLDDLKGRECDNTGFIKVSDFDSLSDDELYNELLVQYVDWLKVKGLQ